AHPRPAPRATGASAAGLRFPLLPGPRAPATRRHRDDGQPARPRPTHGSVTTTAPPRRPAPPICPFFVVIVNGAYIVILGGGQHPVPRPRPRLPVHRVLRCHPRRRRD